MQHNNFKKDIDLLSEAYGQVGRSVQGSRVKVEDNEEGESSTPLQTAKAKLKKLQDWMIEQEDRYHVSGHDLDTWDQLKYLTALVKALEEGSDLPVRVNREPNNLR